MLWRAPLTLGGLNGPATPKFGHATAWYTRVNTTLKVLSLAFNTVNNLFSQALVTSLHVDKSVNPCSQ